ncbi:MAG: MBL fold metallo-hydrolase [Gemmatimonadota bacterium]|nr:MBL fold metallo-hydrolase [Gemmatimonadota bacterium]
MIFRRIYDEALAQASYLVACEACDEAIIVDPNRDVEQYIDMARREGVRIAHVTETHIHADFVSGARELAAATGAQLWLSGEGGADWQYAFAKSSGARLLHDGDTITLGAVRVTAMHTPGHTPEHLTFLVTDGATAETPVGALTGDFIFVGEVGRPDLLERAAGKAGSMEVSARDLFRSLTRFAALPDHLQIWPGHGAGSACGKSLGAMPQSTLGYERIANWALAPQSEEAFVQAVLEGQPEPPTYFARMKRVNRDGPPELGGFRRPTRVPDASLEKVVSDGSQVIDTRPAAQFAERYVPGTINISFNKAFPTWAGWLVRYDEPLYLIADESQLDATVRALAMIGVDNAAGWFATSAVAAESHAQSVPQMTVAELATRVARNEVTVVDVRGRSEWEEGHLPGVINIPVGHLRERIAELPRDKPLVMQCQGGGRSAIAASVALALGMTDVINLVDGFAVWQRDGRPVES